jgi:hypothetical protein
MAIHRLSKQNLCGSTKSVIGAEARCTPRIRVEAALIEISLIVVLVLTAGMLVINQSKIYAQEPDEFKAYLPVITQAETETSNIMLHYVPQYISEIDGRVSSDKPLRKGKTVIHTGGLGDVSASSVLWSVGDFTGFYPTGNPGDFQRGGTEDFYGSSAVQLQGYTAGMHINSCSSPATDTYKLAQVFYGWWQGVFPWRYGSKANLCVGHYAAVPNSWTGGGSINYTYAAIAVRDMSTGNVLWIAMVQYDSRGEAALVETPIWWKELNSPLAMGYYGGQRYSSLVPTSHESTGQTWNDWRYYGFCVSRDQLEMMINEVNSRFDQDLSTNPDDYGLELFGIGPEMYTADGTRGHMSMQVKEIWVFTWVDDQGGYAIPVCGGQDAAYHQMWDAGSTPAWSTAWSTPRIRVEPLKLAAPTAEGYGGP